MIIEGNKVSPSKPCGESKNLAKHLQRADANEFVAVREIRGLAADTIDEALAQIDALADCTRASKPAYHAKINIEAGARLTPEQWEATVERLEQSLGFEGQPRVVVEHIKNDHQHLHVVWSRIDLENGIAIDTPNNFEKHEAVARACEKEFGLEAVKGAFHGRDPNEPEAQRNMPNWEYHRAGRLSIKTPREMKAEVTALREGCESGQDYQAALDKAGYIVAKGDRSGYCVISPDGGVHNLARYSGMKAADLRTFMSDIDRDKLPTVEEAQERAAKVREAVEEKRQDPEPHPSTKASEKQEGITHDASVAVDRGLFVVGGMTNAAGKVLDKIADVAEAILSLFDPPTPRTITPQELFANEAARKERQAQIEAEKERQAAIDRIRESIRQTKTVMANDLHYLSRDDLEQLKAKGDGYLKDIIRQNEAEQKRQHERFRER